MHPFRSGVSILYSFQTGHRGSVLEGIPCSFKKKLFWLGNKTYDSFSLARFFNKKQSLLISPCGGCAFTNYFLLDILDWKWASQHEDTWSVLEDMILPRIIAWLYCFDDFLKKLKISSHSICQRLSPQATRKNIDSKSKINNIWNLNHINASTPRQTQCICVRTCRAPKFPPMKQPGVYLPRFTIMYNAFVWSMALFLPCLWRGQQPLFFKQCLPMHEAKWLQISHALRHLFWANHSRRLRVSHVPQSDVWESSHSTLAVYHGGPSIFPCLP